MNARKLAENIKSMDSSKKILSGMVDRSVETRCSICNRLIFLGKLGKGTLIESKCSKCNQLTCIAIPK